MSGGTRGLGVIQRITSSGSGGSGNVTGPASSVNNDIAIFNGTTGKIIADSGIQVSSISGGPFLPLAGGTMAGNINMGGHQIVGFNSNLTLDGGDGSCSLNAGANVSIIGAESVDIKAQGSAGGVLTIESPLFNLDLSGNATIGNSGIASTNPSTLTVNGPASCWYQLTLFDDLGITSSQILQGEGGNLSISAPSGIFLEGGNGSITTGSNTVLDDGSGNMTVDNTLYVPGGYLTIGNSGVGGGGALISLYNSIGTLGGEIQANTYGAGIDFYTTGDISFAGGEIVMDASGNITATLGTGLITCNSLAVVNNVNTTGNLTMTGGGGGTGIITAKNLVTNGGLSTQFLKGDGTLDSNTYLPYKTKGTVTLVAGTKAVTITGVTTSNMAFVQLTTPGGTLGAAYKAVCTANTLTVTAESVAGGTVTTDTSTLNYLIV